MKLKDLKLMMFVTDDKEVLIRSETNTVDNFLYSCWQTFVDDFSNDELCLDDSAFFILVGENVVTLWVV